MTNNIEKARNELSKLKIEDFHYIFKKHLNRNICWNRLDIIKEYIFHSNLTSIDIIECIYNHRYNNDDRYVLIDEYGLFSFNDLGLLRDVLFTIMDKEIADEIIQIIKNKKKK